MSILNPKWIKNTKAKTDTATIAMLVCLVTLMEKIKPMKKILISLIFIFLGSLNLFSQEKNMVTGEVTFANFKNIYVKLATNDNLTSGDTLLILVKTMLFMM